MLVMSIGELARYAGRSVDTIKRWERLGLLVADRDSLGRRRFDRRQIDRCLELCQLALEAQRRSKSLTDLVADLEPPRLPLLGKLK
jgi:DNA-binding transcriptional MerR regulator